MNVRSIVRYLSICVVTAGVSACATQQTAEVATPEEVAAEAREPGLADEPSQPLTVSDLVGRMSDDGRATYSVVSNSYQFYAGGDISAEYSVTDETLMVSDVAGGGEPCNFSLDGALQGGPEDGKARAKLEKQCQGLVQRLGGYLAQ